MKYSLSENINNMVCFDFEYIFNRFLENEKERIEDEKRQNNTLTRY